jgi:hypothetical protein
MVLSLFKFLVLQMQQLFEGGTCLRVAHFITFNILKTLKCRRKEISRLVTSYSGHIPFEVRHHKHCFEWYFD